MRVPLKRPPPPPEPKRIRQIIVVSDLHCGCRLGLCPPGGVQLDNGGPYFPSDLQRRMWECWEEFWTEWVPRNTQDEPFAVVLNGDVVEGRHHRTTTQISQNLADQAKVARECIRYALDTTNDAPLYWVRGTDAHVGPSGEDEERLASELGAVPNAVGQYARHELRLRVGEILVDIQHHIAPVNSNAYETTALQKEFVIACEEAGRWNQEAPDVIVRSHRHRLAKTEVPTAKGSGVVISTPGWQLKTPFVYRLAGARQSLSQVGGILVRHGESHIYTKHKVWSIPRAPVEEL